MEGNNWFANDFYPDLQEETIYLRDPVYGLVPFTRSEVEILSLPEIRRLSGIRQNSFLEYVFPGANHTRLQHSIGVAFLLDKIFCNTYLKKEKETWEKTVKSSEFRTVRRFVRLAGLLHDIGHGPFSHASEKWLSILNHGFIQYLKESEPRFKNLKPHEIHTSKLIEEAEGNFKECILKSIFSENRADIGTGLDELKALAHFSVGIFDFKDSESLRHNGNFGDFSDLRWLNRIINGDYDADRLDYHLRDPIFAGVSYGATDFSRFLRLTSIFEKIVTPITDKANYGLGTELAIETERGLGTLESIDIQRAVMYPYVYKHSTSRGINEMLSRAVLAVKQILESEANIKPENDDRAFFLGYRDKDDKDKTDKHQWPTFYNQTDYVFLFELDSFLKKYLPQGNKFRSIVEDVINRNIFKKIRVDGEYTPSKDEKRPLFLRIEEISKLVIDRLKGFDNKRDLERLLLWCRRLEISLEQYLNQGNIGPITDPYKYTSVIIDIPFLPLESAKKLELKGIDKNKIKRNLSEYLKTRQASIDIERREWFIAFYGTEDFIERFSEQNNDSNSESPSEGHNVSDIKDKVGKTGSEKTCRQKRFLQWLESFFLSQGDGLACNIEDLSRDT